MSGAVPDPRVLLIRGERTARRLVLPPFGTLSIGSDAGNDVVLTEPGVLARHAALHLDFGVAVELGGGASLAVLGEGARRTVKGPATVDLELSTAIALGGTELRVEAVESGDGERHLLAGDLIPDDADLLRIRIDGAIEEAEAAEVLFSVLSDVDAAYDLGDGQYAIHRGDDARPIEELLAARFSSQGFRMLGAGDDAPTEAALQGAPIEDVSTEPFGSLRDELAALEKKRILQALEKFPNQQEAAKALDIPIRTFVNRMDALGIPRARRSKKKD